MQSHNNNNGPTPEDVHANANLGTLAYSVSLGEINLLNSLPQDPTIMHTLLHVDNTFYFFPIGTNTMYLRNNDGAESIYGFTTPHALGIRKDNYGNLVCDIYDANPNHSLGRGAFGVAYNVLGTIKYRYDNAPGYKFEESDDKGVVKIGEDNPDFGDDYVGGNYIARVSNEFEIANDIPHLRARQPLFNMTADNKVVSALLFRKLKGKTLREIIDNDQSDPAHQALSLDDRFQLSIALYKALQDQFHARGYLHCDIKPENIMADHDEKGWHVKILDVNLAAKIGNEKNSFSGTRAYADGDALAGIISEKSDNFAMSLTVGHLWDNILVNYSTQNEPQPTWLDIARRTLTAGTDEETLTRYSVYQCENEFELAYLSHRKEKMIPAFQHDEADKGLQAGMKIRVLLANNYSISIQDIIDRNEHFIKEVMAMLQALPESQVAMSECIQSMGVKSLHGIDDKQKLMHEISHILEKFRNKLLELNRLQQKLTGILEQMEHVKLSDPANYNEHAANLQQYIDQLNMFCDRVLKKVTTPTVLDTIAEESDHLQRKLIKVKTAKKHFQSLLPQTVKANELRPPTTFRL